MIARRTFKSGHDSGQFAVELHVNNGTDHLGHSSARGRVRSSRGGEASSEGRIRDDGAAGDAFRLLANKSGELDSGAGNGYRGAKRLPGQASGIARETPHDSWYEISRGVRCDALNSDGRKAMGGLCGFSGDRGFADAKKIQVRRKDAANVLHFGSHSSARLSALLELIGRHEYLSLLRRYDTPLLVSIVEGIRHVPWRASPLGTPFASRGTSPINLPTYHELR